MIGLMQPVLNGIGGDLFAIVYDPRTHKLYGYNASGWSPKGRDLAMMTAEVAAAYKKAGMTPRAPPSRRTARASERSRLPWADAPSTITEPTRSGLPLGLLSLRSKPIC